jgi:NADPH2:quinone reductase
MNSAITTEGSGISYKNFSSPTLQSRSVILEHQALGLNYDDIKVLDGRVKNPNKYGIFGIEASGVVVASSRDGIKNFKEGDRLCYATYNPGAFVKYRSIQENYLIPVPKYCEITQGATLLKGLIAYTLLCKVFIIKPPSSIVLTGASGGVGSIITQIATRAGFNLIALTSSNSKKEFIASNGAKHIVNYKKENVIEAVMEITQGKGADFFFDCLGKDVEDFAFKILKTRGFFLSFGKITGESKKFNLELQREKSITATGISMSNFIEDYANLVTTSLAYFKSIQANVVKPKITSYKFENAEQAFKDIKNGVSFGQKVLIL